MDWTRGYVNDLVERGRIEKPAIPEIHVSPAPPRKRKSVLQHSDLDLTSDEPSDGALHYDREYQVANIAFGSKADAVGGARGRYRYLQLLRHARNDLEVVHPITAEHVPIACDAGGRAWTIHEPKAVRWMRTDQSPEFTQRI